jgi:nitrogenase molybdenum-iron protein alpha/beta subunit
VNPHQVTLLASSAFGPGDVEELKEMVESFGLTPIVVPDLSTSLDGHLDDLDYYTTPTGGTTVQQLQRMSVARRPPWCSARASTGPPKSWPNALEVPTYFFDQLTGLTAVDRFLDHLSQFSGRPVPAKYQRQRRRVQDAMLDTHFLLWAEEGCDRPRTRPAV